MVGNLAAEFYDPERKLDSASVSAFNQTMAGIAGVLVGGDTSGALTAALAAGNAVDNNRQLHQGEYDFAKKYAKPVAQKLGITEQEAEGRIVAETLRNSDKDTAVGTGGKHDYQVRSILGCGNLNCDGAKNDPNYANHNYNSQFIEPNLDSYDLGLSQLPTGQTYDQLVTGNAQKDPFGMTVAGAGMVGLGYLTGGTGTALGVKLFGAGVGAGMNALFQSGPTDWIDVGLAGATGFITTGAGLGSSAFTNVGGSLFGSAIKGENPNAGMGGALVGTVLGYGVGKGIEIPINGRANPWWRPQWRDVGYGMSTFNPPSPVPGMVSNVFSSGAQEQIGNDVKNGLQEMQKK